MILPLLMIPSCLEASPDSPPSKFEEGIGTINVDISEASTCDSSLLKLPRVVHASQALRDVFMGLDNNGDGLLTIKDGSYNAYVRSIAMLAKYFIM